MVGQKLSDQATNRRFMAGALQISGLARPLLTPEVMSLIPGLNLLLVA